MSRIDSPEAARILPIANCSINMASMMSSAEITFNAVDEHIVGTQTELLYNLGASKIQPPQPVLKHHLRQQRGKDVSSVSKQGLEILNHFISRTLIGHSKLQQVIPLIYQTTLEPKVVSPLADISAPIHQCV